MDNCSSNSMIDTRHSKTPTQFLDAINTFTFNVDIADLIWQFAKLSSKCLDIKSLELYEPMSFCLFEIVTVTDSSRMNVSEYLFIH